jgi:hypothetical protein
LRGRERAVRGSGMAVKVDDLRWRACHEQPR